jgi:hypothetical protein
MREQARFDKKTGTMTKASGTFMYERKDDGNPAEHCSNNGTIQTEATLP